MNDFKIEYDNYNSEYLLELRARGDMLPDDAHAAIEKVFLERSEFLPPRPSSPINLNQPEPSMSSDSGFLGGLIRLGFIISAVVVGEVLGHTWLGVVVAASLVVYFVVDLIRQAQLSPEEYQMEEDEKKAKRDNLSEMMMSSANGDVSRCRELVAFGKDVNARSSSGITALMLAVRNNHVETVDYLLSVGANPRLKSKAGTSAIDIAKKQGHKNIIESLEQHQV